MDFNNTRQFHVAGYSDNYSVNSPFSDGPYHLYTETSKIFNGFDKELECGDWHPRVIAALQALDVGESIYIEDLNMCIWLTGTNNTVDMRTIWSQSNFTEPFADPIKCDTPFQHLPPRSVRMPLCMNPADDQTLHDNQVEGPLSQTTPGGTRVKSHTLMLPQSILPSSAPTEEGRLILDLRFFKNLTWKDAAEVFNKKRETNVTRDALRQRLEALLGKRRKRRQHEEIHSHIPMLCRYCCRNVIP